MVGRRWLKRRKRSQTHTVLYIGFLRTCRPYCYLQILKPLDVVVIGNVTMFSNTHESGFGESRILLGRRYELQIIVYNYLNQYSVVHVPYRGGYSIIINSYRIQNYSTIIDVDFYL